MYQSYSAAASIQTTTSRPNSGYLTPVTAETNVPYSVGPRTYFVKFSDADFQIVNDISRQASVLGWTRRSRHHQQLGHDWFTCIAVRQISGIDIDYVIEPPNVDSQVYDAIIRLRDTAVLSIISEVTDLAFDLIKPDQRYLSLGVSGARMPIVENLEAVDITLTASARACFVRKQNVMLVWAENVYSLVNIAQEIQEDLMSLVSMINY